MPDAFGNLLGIQDFTLYRQIRLHSYLDPDVVLACPLGGRVYVHHLSKGQAPEQTILVIQPLRNNSFCLTVGKYGPPLIWVSYNAGLKYGGVNIVPRVGNAVVSSPDEIIFTVDMLDGSCWFALNNHDRTRVADVSKSDTTEGNPIIGFEWNGGDNQRWRAQIV